LKDDKDDLYLRYLCHEEYGKAKILLNKLFSAYKIKDVDADEKLRFIRYNGIRKLKRVSDFKIEETYLLENNNKIILNKISAKFEHRNNWGQRAGWFKSCIFYYQNGQIIWTTRHQEPQIFLKQNNKIYVIEYENKYVTIYSSIEIFFDNIIISKDLSNLDHIFVKYDDYHSNYNAIKIDLTDYFEWGFFFLNYDMRKAGFKYEGSTIIKNIVQENKLFRFDIENITYPEKNYKGYFFIDLENKKVIRGGNSV
jgi:hypothetical protein